MKKFGIDVSHWQGNYDFNKAVNEGVEFVILKLGERSKKDAKFDTYYNKCKELGLPVGCYYFGNAMSAEEAKNEADNFINMLKEYTFELPVYYDVEAKMLNSTNENLQKIVETFCTTVQDAGYFVGIYSSASTFARINDKKFTHWVAKWSTKEPTDWDVWQFGGETNYLRSNKVAGVTTDQNYLKRDFTTIIKQLGLNGFKKEEEKPVVNPMVEKINNIIKELEEIKNGLQ